MRQMTRDESLRMGKEARDLLDRARALLDVARVIEDKQGALERRIKADCLVMEAAALRRKGVKL